MANGSGPATAAARRSRPRGLSAVYALPAGCAALLLTGAIAAASHGGLSAGWVLGLAAVIVAGVCCLAEPGVTLFVAAVGWLTANGFSGPPYAQLRFTEPAAARAALVISLSGLAGAGAGLVMRRLASSFTLWIVEVSGDGRPAGTGARTGDPQPASAGSAAGAARPDAPGVPGHRGRGRRGRTLPAQGRPGGLARRRQLAGVALLAILPVLTAVLLPAKASLSLSDDLLIYLVAVVVVALVGGFWPAVAAAVAASLLLNYYFTVPLHTFIVANPQDVLSLLLFVTVAVTVSSVVHLAARRAVQAARSAEDAAALLALAQTVLGGQDTPAAILGHLTATRGGSAELAERAGSQWVRVAAAGSAPPEAAATRVAAGADLELVVAGQAQPLTPRLLQGFAAQAAAALDRDRLRTQAAQAEALAEGNRMRTALLAAVSHDLRTPLASIKASVSTLRQAGVQLTDEDEAALLANIEESADRLNELIGNLLDMSRLSTGSLEPFLRPASLDEVAPVAQQWSDAGPGVEIVIPDDLPLVRTDPGLLERVLANLFANAIAHSPAGRPPSMSARREGDRVLIDVVDHGRGVPDALKARMFEPFERLGERNTGTGVGLGLAVARGFLDAMGGSVSAADTPGGGLTMRVALQVADVPASDPVAADQ